MRIRYRPYFAEKGKLYLICWIRAGCHQYPVIARTKPELETKAKKMKERVR